jgi:hypothetical protein
VSKKERKKENERWAALFDTIWSDNSRHVNERWGIALDFLQQHRDPTGVLTLLAAGAPVPDWVRKELALWHAGERPALPNFSDEDRKLLAAKRAYDEAPWLPGEKQDDKKERIAREQARRLGIKKNSIRAFLNYEGRAYLRHLAGQKWERIYLDPDCFKK